MACFKPGLLEGINRLLFAKRLSDDLHFQLRPNDPKTASNAFLWNCQLFPIYDSPVKDVMEPPQVRFCLFCTYSELKPQDSDFKFRFWFSLIQGNSISRRKYGPLSPRASPRSLRRSTIKISSRFAFFENAISKLTIFRLFFPTNFFETSLRRVRFFRGRLELFTHFAFLNHFRIYNTTMMVSSLKLLSCIHEIRIS